MERKIKILLAKLGLDVHNRGVITVAMGLRDAGMESQLRRKLLS